MTWLERAPVQGSDSIRYPRNGTITWAEHLEVWEAYAAKYGRSQSPERIAERGGFSYYECTMLLGHAPKTWKVSI